MAAMDKIKAKMQALRTEADVAIEKADKLEITIKEYDARHTADEHEISEKNRKIQMLEDDLDRAEERALDLQTRLEAAEKIAEESERQLRVMSSHNDSDGGRVIKLESKLKEAQAELTEVERLFEENTRKLALLDAELDKAEERAEVAEKKVRVQEAELSAALVELKTLALHGEKASASDESANKKVKALGATLRETELHVEEQQRRIRELEMANDKIQVELEKTRLLYQEAKSELDDALKEITDM